MSVVAFGSAKGSPGVTTTVLALAATWPDGPVTVIEADPAGGDLAAWLDLPLQPGLVSLAAAGRRTIDEELFEVHLQALPGSERVSLLCGPVAAEQTHAALSSLRERLLEAAVARGGVTLVDCGRLGPTSPALPLFDAADVRILVGRPGVAAVHHIQARARALPAPAPELLVVGEDPYTPEQVAEVCALALAGALPFDRRAADTLGDGPSLSDRALNRSALVRTARSLAEHLSRRLARLAGPATSTAPTAPDAAAPDPTAPELAVEDGAASAPAVPPPGAQAPGVPSPPPAVPPPPGASAAAIPPPPGAPAAPAAPSVGEP